MKLNSIHQHQLLEPVSMIQRRLKEDDYTQRFSGFNWRLRRFLPLLLMCIVLYICDISSCWYCFGYFKVASCWYHIAEDWIQIHTFPPVITGSLSRQCGEWSVGLLSKQWRLSNLGKKIEWGKFWQSWNIIEINNLPTYTSTLNLKCFLHDILKACVKKLCLQKNSWNKLK